MESTKLAAPFGALLFAGIAAAATPGAVEDTATTKIYSQRGKDAYVLSLGTHFTSTNLSLDEMQSLRHRISGDFLWARRARKAYVIRDEQTLKQARAAFDPLRALDPDREAIERLRAPIESRQTALDREQEELDRAADRFDDDDEDQDQDRNQQPADHTDLERRRRTLEERLRALERDEKHVDALEEELDRKEEALETSCERDLWRLIDAAITRGLARRVEKD